MIQFESRVYYAKIHNQPLAIASTIGLLSWCGSWTTTERGCCQKRVNAIHATKLQIRGKKIAVNTLVIVIIMALPLL